MTLERLTQITSVGISSGITLSSATLTGVTTLTTLSAGGDIDAVNGTFSGNLNVAGVLTYEDVSNVDSVGVVTARSGLNVTGGNVGIGTDNPQNKLQVFLNAPLSIPSAGTSGHHATIGDVGFGVAIGALNSGKSYIQGTRWDGTSANYDLLLQPNGGNLGIGTNSPTRKLDVEIQTASGAVGSVLSSHPIAEFINISAGAPRGLEIGAPPDGFLSPVYLKVSGTGSRFAILDQSNHENFTILDSGNTGIGTDNPGAKLHIDGGTNNTPLVVEASQNNRSRLVFRNNQETGTQCVIELIDEDLRFNTNSGERMRIVKDGNIGIGLTVPNAKLHVGTGNAVGNATNPAIQLGGTTTYRLGFYTTSEGGVIDAANGDNGLSIHTKNAGEAIRILSNGLLLNYPGSNSTILGRYKYTQQNQGQLYNHLILGPDGQKLQDSLANQNKYCEIIVTTLGTGTSVMYCKYLYVMNSDNNAPTLTNIRGNTGSSSNRPFMELINTVDPVWKMNHAGGYLVDVCVNMYGGGEEGVTYSTSLSNFGANP